MIKIIIILTVLFSSSSLHCQTVQTSATYYESGINSPWMIGIDYDFGFEKFLSMNVQFTGGVSSQVNRASTFGDIFMGELQFGPRLYMGKIDSWMGLYLSIVGRVGIYNIPIRSVDTSDNSSKLIIDRVNMFQYGMGIYIGYKWRRGFVKDMKDIPFTLILEPYVGWTLDFLTPLSSSVGNSGAVNRFSAGLSFKISFYTHKKSKETLQKELEDQASLDSETNTNTTNSDIIDSED